SRSSLTRMRVLPFAIAILAAFTTTTCALFAPPQPQKLSDGSWELKCNDRLAACLTGFEGVCDWHGYDVVRATEDRRRTDIREARREIITSEAVVRCKRGAPLFSGSEPAPAPPAPTPPPAAAVPPPALPPPATTPTDAGAPRDAGAPLG